MGRNERFEEALQATDPVAALRALALALNAEGWRKADVLHLFESYQAQLRDSGREAEEDAVLDVLDFLTGWCSPHMKILPEEKVHPAEG
jgi:hypothetical protein